MIFVREPPELKGIKLDIPNVNPWAQQGTYEISAKYMDALEKCGLPKNGRKPRETPNNFDIVAHRCP